jgi:hypothetical protein
LIRFKQLKLSKGYAVFCQKPPSQKTYKSLPFFITMKYATYIMIISFGALIAIGTVLKLSGVIDINSDWFWFLAGTGLFCEGIISLLKQKQFDKKYKIVERD